jgi:dTDP-4-amino-4,6-dideoxygalactose transaminase
MLLPVYVPLHSPAGRRYGRANGDLIVTNDLSSRPIRLLMWVGLQEAVGTASPTP